MRNSHVSVALALSLPLLAVPAGAQHDADAAEPIPRLFGTVVVWAGAEVPEDLRTHVFEKLRTDTERKKLGMVLPGYDGENSGLMDWSKVGFNDFEVHSPDPTRQFISSDLRSTLDETDAVLLGDVDPGRMLADWAEGGIRRRLERCIGRGGVVVAAGRAGELVGGPVAEGAPSLGLLAGTVVLSPFDPADEAHVARVDALLEDDPTRVVLGVEADTALVLDERFYRARGAGAVHAFVAASKDRPRRVDVVTGTGRGDLIALWRSAWARHARPFPAKEPGNVRLKKGSLVLVGGGGVPPGLLERFVELAGGPDAPLVYVPCSYERTIDQEPGFVRQLRAAGATDVTWIHTKDREESDGDAEILDPLRRAKGVWFGGGRQWNLVDSYQHTEAHALMEDVLARDGVIGGSSAGASIQAEYMARGGPLGNREIMVEGYEEGLGFLRGCAVDQHFTQRGRGPDLASLVRTYPQYLGIGIDESTAIVVQSHVAEVVGAHADRHVYFYDGEREEEDDGAQLWDAVAPGGRYDLRKRRVLADDE